MTPAAPPKRSKHPRFPADMISHGVWLDYRCGLSDRAVDELLCARGILVTDEALRKWGPKCGQASAHQ